MAVQKKLYRVDQFDQFVKLPENANRRFEFIDGETVEVPSNPYSSEIASIINRYLGNHVYPKRLGHITGEQGGYMVAGARLAPDVAFVARSRQAALVREGYNPIAPDLAVEVVSSTDNMDDLQKKLEKYAEAGVLTWVVYPERRQVEVRAPGQPVRTLSIEDTLDGGEVLPGFSLPVRDIFPE